MPPDAAEAFQGEVIGKVVNLDGAQPSVPRFSTTVADRTATGEVGAMALYAGESVGAVKRVLRARGTAGRPRAAGARGAR